jgi:hypothetical protein
MRKGMVLLAVPAMLALGLLGTNVPAGAHPPEGDDTHTQSHTSPGGNSQNMKQKAFVPKSSNEFQSDLAFWGDYAFAGNYNGFRIIDISDSSAPTVVKDVWCPGQQGDISVWGDIILLSVDQVMLDAPCGSAPAPAARVTESTNWEGIRVFSLAQVLATAADADGFTRLQPVANIYLDCGSHTHTINPRGETLVVYNSSYSLRSGPTCGPENAEAKGYDPQHGKIGVVQISVANPADYEVSYDELDPDTPTWNLISGPGFNPMRACHDIQVHQGLGLAAAACASEGQLWDISDPLDPKLVWRTDEPAVEFYHSALFSEEGQIVVFGDEIVTTGSHCNQPGIGRLWFHDRANGTTLGSHQTPRSQQGPEGPTYCSAHLFNNIPTSKGRVLVASWYSAGTAVVDYTDPANAREIGFFDPPDTETTRTSTWSAYWYNGFIYTGDGTGRVGTDRSFSRGMDVFLFSDRTRAGTGQKQLYLNPQGQ